MKDQIGRSLCNVLEWIKGFNFMKKISIPIIIFMIWGICPMVNAKNTEKNIEIYNDRTPIKLIFIHHSVGGSWLAHGFGGLANELINRKI